MRVTIRKLTDVKVAKEALGVTVGQSSSKMTLGQLYRCEHSPMRTQVFWVLMEVIPTYVSVHMVRHHVGVEHFVRSHRVDRGGTGDEDRMSPVNHGMFINAQALVNMARKRLCHKADRMTYDLMVEIKNKMTAVDPALAVRMVPECKYRGGVCHEPKPCGLM